MQFKEMLKNLNLQKSSAKRTGAKEPKRDVNQVESTRPLPPKAYQSAFEKFTRDVNRQKPAAANRPNESHRGFVLFVSNNRLSV